MENSTRHSSKPSVSLHCSGDLAKRQWKNEGIYIRIQKDILIWSKFYLMKTDLVLFLSFHVLLRMDLWMAAIRRVLRQKRRHWFRAKRMNSMIPLTRVMLFKHERNSMAFNFYILHYENPPHYIIEDNLQEFRNCYCSYCCHIWRNRIALKKY